ncbi:DUF2934 domain-containing protein [Methylobacterium sp. E-046]|uniref:DUF2934 domain-containing protein n=1 Tax=Methylobacterium sp. E-046 TaxID=2836576 RepID=UPI001FB8FF83|nr:DUF2934 domain-containing protein [Methylobacterium sp. E-046]MCJ2102807.1 DUF2934 domain-containing protein [Methylobacterium sp. E-046]
MEPAEVPSSYAIRERAYDLWDRHHRPDGYDLQFWLMAERELRAEQRASQDGNQVEGPDE